VNGRNHALSGLLAWLAVAPPAAEAMGHPLALPVVAAGALVTAGAAVLPDIDHPGSSASRTLGPVSQLTALGVAAVAGGHRQRTHSLAFVALAGGAAALAAAAGPGGAGVIAGLGAALAVRLIGPRPWRSGLGPLGVAVAVGWSVATAVPVGSWLPAAVVLGSLVHLLGDVVTAEGVPLLWPARGRVAVPLLRSGGPGETVVTMVCSALILWRTYQVLQPMVHSSGS
jgi:membrane-bound metal-dependent hydrolase YbcI (DUF457 family)